MADLSGPGGGRSVAVGSVDFAESMVLGHVLREWLTRHGVEVSDRVGTTGGHAATRQALLAGEIDVYVAHTGIPAAVGLPDDAYDVGLQDRIEAVDADQHDVRWIGRSAFASQLAVLASRATAQAVADGGTARLADVATFIHAEGDVLVAAGAEPALATFASASGYAIPPGKTVIMPVADHAAFLRDRPGALVLGPTTSALAGRSDVVVLVRFGPSHRASVCVRGPVATAHAQVLESFATTVLDGLDDAAIARVDTEVAGGGATAAVAARALAFLTGDEAAAAVTDDDLPTSTTDDDVNAALQALRAEVAGLRGEIRDLRQDLRDLRPGAGGRQDH